MPSAQVKLYHLKNCGIRTPHDFIGSLELSNDSPFRSIEITSILKDIVDIEASWEEKRTVPNVVSNGEEVDFQIVIRRHGWARIASNPRTVLITTFGKLVRQLLVELWSPNPLPDICPYKVDLRRTIKNGFSDRGKIYENVRLIDLPLEDIPSLNVSIPTCTKRSLLGLVKDTSAIVDCLTIGDSEQTKLTITRTGSVKVAVSEFEWSETAARVTELLNHIVPETER